MLILDEELNEDDRELLMALDAYLHDRMIASDRYLIAPSGTSEIAEYSLKFDSAAAPGALKAHVRWPLIDGDAHLVAQLPAGIRLFAMLLGEDYAERTQIPLALGPRDSIARLGLPYGQYWKPTLLAQPDQLFVRAKDDGFELAYMDVRPPVAVLSRSSNAAPVAVHLAVALAEEKADIASTLAQFLP